MIKIIMSTEISINERIRQVIDYYGFSTEDFVKKFDGNKGTLNNIIGGRKSAPSYELINKIAVSYEEIDVNWLITGRGTMLVKDIDVNFAEEVRERKRDTYRLKTDKNIANQDVPLYSIEATAGIVGLFRDTNNNQPIDYISVPNLPKCDGAVYVTGDSMYPLLKSGDIVMYKEIKNLPDGMFFGEMYLISLDVDGDEFISVKWLHRSDLGDEYIKLVSENRHHPPKDVKLKHVKAMALIKASVRMNSMY